MQNPKQDFVESSSVFEKPGILSGKLKTLMSSNYHFCWNFAHFSYLPMSKKECSGYFLFSLELELFAKIKKDLVSTHSHKSGLTITQDLNKIKKISNNIL